MDIKYYIIRALQSFVHFSNYVQKKFYSHKKITLQGDEHLLIIKADRIGDAVRCIYFIRSLLLNYSKLKFTIVCNQYNAFVFQQHKDLFENIYILSEAPPYYLVKQFHKVFGWFAHPFDTFRKSKSLWQKLKKQGFDYTINLTGRKYFLVSKYIGKNAGAGFWPLNFLYNYPIQNHQEIGAKQHIVKLWLNLFENINKYYIPVKKPIQSIKKVLLYIWVDENRWTDAPTYKKITTIFSKKWYNIYTISEKKSDNPDYLLTKNKYGLRIGSADLKDFIKGYDLFIWFDNGLIHYLGQYMNVCSIITYSNPYAVHPWSSHLTKIIKYGWRKIYITQNKTDFLLTKTLKCQWCFQVWCLYKYCKKSLDIVFQIFINKLPELDKKKMKKNDI